MYLVFYRQPIRTQNMTEEKEKTIFKRSLSLSPKTNADLLALAEVLGVNPHSYMVNELAKAIQRDSIAFQMKKSTEDQLSKLIDVISQASESQED